MASYTGIAEVSKRMVELLQQQLVPELIPDGNKICLCSPDERKDTVLGIFLYDVRESEEIRRSGMIHISSDRQAYPPIYISLYYMITAYVSSDLKFRMFQEQQILGKVVQYLHDYPILPFDQKEGEQQVGTDMQIQIIPMEAEEKAKLWNFGTQPYRLSLFYKVSPLLVESAREREVIRVREVEINVDQMNEKPIHSKFIHH